MLIGEYRFAGRILKTMKRIAGRPQEIQKISRRLMMLDVREDSAL